MSLEFANTYEFHVTVAPVLEIEEALRSKGVGHVVGKVSIISIFLTSTIDTPGPADI
jgi:hypothetical protein